MLFPTVQFALFFFVVFLGNWLLMQRPRKWRVFMLIASYFFYGFWDWRFIWLLAGATVVNQACAVAIHRARDQRRRKTYVGVALAADLVTLGFFKYYGFFVTSLIAGFKNLGLEPNLPLLEIILPVGISFFTFQAMSYVIDVYRRDLEPAPWLDFSVYLAFFPQLVAGPIVRGTEFLPQLKRPRDPRYLDTGRAFYLIAIGLTKKIVIADFLATTLVDPVFAGPQLHSGFVVLMAVYGYSIQIYADFSAYSDIAIGVALLLGFEFPDNFNAPYAATSIRDFWRRWHMTLSRWLRDYLYIGLGGNRGGRLLTYRNLMLTMLLGGLWHGAAWKFVIWGGLHGTWLAIERWWSGRRGSPADHQPKGLQIALQRIITFHLVAFAWIFFRADSLDTATTVIGQIATGWDITGILAISPAMALAIAVGIAAQYIPRRAVGAGVARFTRMNPALQGVALAVTLMVIDALGPEGVAAFIYFQF